LTSSLKINLWFITAFDGIHADIDDLHLSLCISSSLLYLFPLGEELLHSDGTVGVDAAGLDAVALGDLLHLVVDPHDGLPLSVCLRERGLKLLVSRNETLERAGGEDEDRIDQS